MSGNLMVGYDSPHPSKAVSIDPRYLESGVRYYDIRPRKLKVGVDVDGCVADLSQTYAFYAHLMQGISPELRPLDWDWGGMGMTKREADHVWDTMQQVHNVWMTLPLLEGTEQISRLAAETKVTFISSPPKKHKGLSFWSQRSIWLDEILGVEEPYGLILAKEKGPVASELKLDYFLDDKPENCYDVLASVPSCKVYLMNASHNQTCRDFPRVESVNEFVGIVLGE